jgi:hypothetical protein
VFKVAIEEVLGEADGVREALEAGREVAGIVQVSDAC